MPTAYYDSQRNRVTLGRQVGRGGEAAVYRVQGRRGLLAKIYLPRPDPVYEHKVAWMKDHPPEEPDYSAAIDEHRALAWPLDLLYNARREFAGYLMPGVSGGVTLLEVFNPRLRAQTLPFDARYLHHTARNLAAAVASLHAKGYVVGDLHESNVLVTPQALVTMIDTDSFQVHARVGGKTVCYPCIVGKPDYTAPELQGQRLADVTRKPEHDNFALAVLVFQLLMNGSHPFRSRWQRAGDPPSLEEKISSGMFPHVDPPPGPVAPPPGVPGLETLHPTLAGLFRRCFVDGHKLPYLRPTALEWREGLAEAEATLVRCPKGHYYAGHLAACPDCALGAARPARRRPSIRPQKRKTAAPPRRPRTTAPPRTSTAPQKPQTVVSSLLQTLASRRRGPRPLRVHEVMLGFAAIVIAGCIIISSLSSLPPSVDWATSTPWYRRTPAPTRTATPQPTATPWYTLTPSPTPPYALSGTPVARPEQAITVETGRQVEPLAMWDEWARDVAREIAWSPDGEQLVVAGRESVRLHDLSTGQAIQLLEEGLNATSVAFSPDGSLLAVGAGRTLRLVEAATARQVLLISVAESPVESIAFSPDGTMLASGSRDGMIRVWDVSTGQSIYALDPGGGFVESVAFSPGGEWLASDGEGSTVRVWNTATVREAVTLDGHWRAVTDVVFSLDGALLASASYDKTVRLWDVPTGQAERTLPEYQDPVMAVAFSSDGRLLAAGTQGGEIVFWDISVEEGGERVGTIEHRRIDGALCVAFSPDGTMLATGGANDPVVLWGVAEAAP